MSGQSLLPGLGEARTPVKVYFTPVRDFAMTYRELPLGKDQKAVFDVITTLLGRSLRPFPLDKTRMKANPRQWISQIIVGFPDVSESTVRFLLTEFCDTLKTRMREENRYAVLLLSEGQAFLAHSRGEMALIESENAIMALQRLLDADNVDRFAQFHRMKDGTITVNYFEYTQTESFREFLGIPEADLYYELGEVRVHTQVGGEHCVFQFRKEDFVRKFREGREGYKIQGNRLTIPGGDFVFDKVFYGRRTFATAEEFLELLDAESYDLVYYADEYSRMVESLEPLMHPIIDRRASVTQMTGQTEQVLVGKSNKNFEILFANRDIRMDPNYSAFLASALVQGSELRVFHAGHPYSSSPLSLGPLIVHNKVKVAPMLSEFASSITGLARDLGHGHIVSDLLWYSAVSLLGEAMEGPMKHALSFVGAALLSSLQTKVPNGTLSENESPALEFKARDWYEPNPDKMASKLKQELDTKLKDRNVLVMLIGYDEQKRCFDLLPSNRCKSEMMSHLEQSVGGSSDLSARILVLPMPSDQALVAVLATRQRKPAAHLASESSPVATARGRV